MHTNTHAVITNYTAKLLGETMYVHTHIHTYMHTNTHAVITNYTAKLLGEIMDCESTVKLRQGPGMYVYIYICMYMYVCEFVCIYVYVCAFMCMYVYLYVNVCGCLRSWIVNQQ